ncbi:MAG: FecR domain-containing protein, partial [Verrucomicrobiota bacterium]
MRRILLVAILWTALPALAWCLPAPEDGTIGVIRNCAGSANIVRGNEVIPAAEGLKLRTGDTLTTGADGSVGLILRDDSCLSIGPDSRMVLEKFLFSPAHGKLGLFARLVKGTMAYLSGMIGKLAPETVRIETPVASIGIRGTCFAVKAGEVATQ